MPSRRKVTTDELREMMRSPRKLPPLSELDTDDCWLPQVEMYGAEYDARTITRLRREKILLREALQETIRTVRRANYFGDMFWSTRWEEHILKLTKDKENDG